MKYVLKAVGECWKHVFLFHLNVFYFKRLRFVLLGYWFCKFYSAFLNLDEINIKFWEFHTQLEKKISETFFIASTFWVHNLVSKAPIVEFLKMLSTRVVFRGPVHGRPRQHFSDTRGWVETEGFNQF